MEITYWIAQIVGVFALIALVSSYQQKKRERLLLCKLCADVLWMTNFALLGGWGGMISNGVGVCRELVFLQRGKRKWASSAVWPIVFILVGWTAFFSVRIFLFSESFSLIHILPIIATTCATFSFWSKSPVMTKAIAIPASGSFLIYNLFIQNYIGVFNEAIGLTSLAIGLARHAMERRRAAKKTQ